ncbi:hypothetical protein IKE72_02305 [Candidatus Saccharibacteria bacterium]|nr:hypothetical protein [Candidatus Saccharibacteria bacterium]
MKISILGAGAFGTALGGVLAGNGYDIDYYDSTLERESLKDNLAASAYVILCVPSKVAPHLLPHLDKNQPLIVTTKGLITDSYFADFTDWMVLSGPGFAADIKEKKPTKFTITDPRIKALFEADYIEYDSTTDRRGVLMCGGLKNVYALLAGYHHLTPQTAEWQDYILAASKEMKSLLELNSANPETVDLACGIGDLELTCTKGSRNYTYGYRVKDDKSYQPECTVEGLSAIKRIRRGEIKIEKDLPILSEILEIFN